LKREIDKNVKIQMGEWPALHTRY